MLVALINNNKIESIVDVESLESIESPHTYQQVVDVTDMIPLPSVGWAFNRDGIYKEYPDLTPKQLRMALVLSGVSSEMVTGGLDLLPSPQKELAQIAWEYAIAYSRRDPLLIGVASQLGWGELELNALWDLGLTL